MEAGYSKAGQLRRFITKVTEAQSTGRASIATKPHTRERQDLLAKMSTAGQFFQITQGGGPLNCTDVLIARARKENQTQAEQLKKEKGDSVVGTEIAQLAKRVLDRDKPSKEWTVAEIRAVIRWKQGPRNVKQKFENLTKLKKEQLVSLYEDKYKNKPHCPFPEWTKEKEDKLQYLLSGEIDEVLDTRVQRALDTEQAFVCGRFLAFCQSRRLKVIDEILAKLDPTASAELVQRVNDAEYSLAGGRLSCGTREQVEGINLTMCDDDSQSLTDVGLKSNKTNHRSKRPGKQICSLESSSDESSTGAGLKTNETNARSKRPGKQICSLERGNKNDVVDVDVPGVSQAVTVATSPPVRQSRRIAARRCRG